MDSGIWPGFRVGAGKRVLLESGGVAMKDSSQLQFFNKAAKVSTVQFQITPQKLDRARICGEFTTRTTGTLPVKCQIDWSSVEESRTINSKETI